MHEGSQGYSFRCEENPGFLGNLGVAVNTRLDHGTDNRGKEGKGRGCTSYRGLTTGWILSLVFVGLGMFGNPLK